MVGELFFSGRTPKFSSGISYQTLRIRDTNSQVLGISTQARLFRYIVTGASSSHFQNTAQILHDIGGNAGWWL